MTNRLFLALACVLLVVRLPSLVEPMGADQGLYAYVGERILAGELPYRHAWDQKPPGVHVAYAAMRAVWPHDSIVAAVDLALAVATAAGVYGLGATLATRGTGQAAALIFVLLSNPAFLRLSGVMVRAQCETFIAAAVTAALFLVVRGDDRSSLGRIVTAGALLGVAFTFKYNAAVYALLAGGALLVTHRLTIRTAVALSAGFAVPVIALLATFAANQALRELYDATIAYNLRYSGETFTGPMQPLAYLLTFPVRHARVDALWLIGCAGCAVLVITANRTAIGNWTRLLPVAWVAAACVAITINGTRDLPQYFVQAAPGLALAAAWAGAVLNNDRRIVNVIVLVIVSFGVWRVNNFQKLVDNTWHDTRYVFGTSTREEHLARYGEPGERKYSAILVERLAGHLRSHTAETDPVYVFGFSCGAYVKAQRVSASRFFWSRPVIAGFNEGVQGYGAAGVLADLQRRPPAIVALQEIDWLGDVDNSAHYFTTHPLLGPWLQANYAKTDGPQGFETWARRGNP